GQQRRGDNLQGRMSIDQFVDPCREAVRRGPPDLQAKAAQGSAHAHLDVVKLRLHKFARVQDRPRLLGRDRLAMHRAEPAKPSSWAMPRASLRSVFTGIALKASRTCRVSRSSTAKPASRSAANNHCDNGPASRPTRARPTPCDTSHEIKASGSLATLPSAMILPLASTTHTLDHSNDTSIPA